ncbi:SH3 domain-containing protein [Parvularcula sp. LCG005]|uniref:SH3 domain-containing protein n=1 Tax=Parvularcula sp. LCG005 TaxID=3078805 RepID=UPI002943A123|nr:SH3 domain-containing protein [Parvularcula sp. LCG005]WOI53444.1 SH3 domain-containing protein [Parvularcula sp. LCG005]
MQLRFTITAAILSLGTAFGLMTHASAGSALTTNTTSTANVVIGPSGLPVPRFVALKKDEVLARFGPSFDYPVAYEFRREGLPLKVIAEDRDNIWRRVEDRDGRRMWIHRSMLSANEHVVVHVDDAVLRAAPDADAQGRAKLAKGVMARVESCDASWCRVRADNFRGWLPKEQLWGAGV